MTIFKFLVVQHVARAELFAVLSDIWKTLVFVKEEVYVDGIAGGVFYEDVRLSKCLSSSNREFDRGLLNYGAVNKLNAYWSDDLAKILS